VSCFDFTDCGADFPAGRDGSRENGAMDANPPEAFPALEAEDYYFEGPNLVFTAAYHLKRGFCCGSGCRHCPYRGAEPEAPTGEDPVAG
jgi:hypothetical protein